MNLDEAFTYISDFDHRFLIIGFMSDGYRGIPATYKTVVTTAKDQDQVFTIIDKLKQYRVFELGKEIMSMLEWEAAMKANEAAKMEKEEKALLEKLKAKYETQ